jgi:2-methylcitrate dehydratase PrpD
MLAEPPARKRAPHTAIDAKFSLPWTIALALVRGEVTLESFDAASLADPALRSLASRVEFHLRPDWERSRATSGTLTLQLSGEGRLHHSVDDALGSPARPLEEAGLVAKFLDCLARSSRPATTAQASPLATRILDLENLPDARTLLD